MFYSINPVTHREVKSFPAFDDQQIEQCLKLAANSFHGFWKTAPLESRVHIILKVRDQLKKDTDRLAELITIEMGKPITQSIAEIRKCIYLCEYYAENAPSFLENKKIDTSASKSYVTYQPLGAVFGIMPWNFPFWQVFRFSVPALLAGNVILLKHAPNVPQCALEIEKLFSDAADDKGVFQSLLIEVDQVEKVIASQIVQGVTLTGSDRAGSSVASLAGKHIKKCVLELGGTDAYIVCHDADLEKAASIAIKSRMNNCGQTCISAKRFIVEASILDQFTSMLEKEIGKLKMGDPLEPETEISCLARPDLAENLERQIDSSVAAGAQEIVQGGRENPGSNFFKPALLTNIEPEMAVYREEVFGPVGIIIPFKNDSEAIEIANDSKYGLGAAVWTKDLQRAEEIALHLEVGTVVINDMVKSDPRLPFGGVKRSGFGRELSIEGIREFVNVKTIVVA